MILSHNTFRVFAAWALLSLLTLAGCGYSSSEVNTIYGRRLGKGATSVNGTGVFARMFTNAGHRVYSRGRSGGKIDDCDVIVWAPDRFSPPTEDERSAIQTWLSEGYGRTFIYIGRDYDAGVEYWQRAASLATAADAEIDADTTEEYLRRAALELAVFEAARANIPADEDATWFVVSRDHPPARVTGFTGPWSENFDAASANIWTRSRFEIPESRELDADPYYFDEKSVYHEVLLATAPQIDLGDDDPFDEAGGFRAEEGTPLVTQITHPYWEDSSVITIPNGSFLLNLPLVNHEHRRIAARIVDECGIDPMRVAFWDRDTFSPADATAEQHHQWSILTTWPLNFILLHFGVLGLMYIMWKYPIFGPAKDLPPPSTSDFAHHINAMGDLMAATNEVGYARAKLQAYKVNVRGDARDDQTPLRRSPSFDAAAMEFQNSDAMAEFRRGDYHEALRLANRMIEAQPQRSVLWQFKGECQFKLQRYDEALTSFQQLQSVGGPQAEEAFLWISLCHHNAGRTREAKGVLQQFVSDPPKDADPELISKAKAAIGKLEPVKSKR